MYFLKIQKKIKKILQKWKEKKCLSGVTLNHLKYGKHSVS